jgi:hypothetical protein
MHTYGLVFDEGASAEACNAAAKQLDKGWGLHYKPLQGITG